MENGGLTDGSKASAKKKEAWYRMEVLIGVKMVFWFWFWFCFIALRLVFSVSLDVCEFGVFSLLFVTESDGLLLLLFLFFPFTIIARRWLLLLPRACQLFSLLVSVRVLLRRPWNLARLGLLFFFLLGAFCFLWMDPFPVSFYCIFLRRLGGTRRYHLFCVFFCQLWVYRSGDDKSFPWSLLRV